MRQMFLRLTELGEATEDTRKRASLAEFITEGEGAVEAAWVVDRLSGARLLVVDDDSIASAERAACLA